jgi:hypothetical protein
MQASVASNCTFVRDGHRTRPERGPPTLDYSSVIAAIEVLGALAMLGQFLMK